MEKWRKGGLMYIGFLAVATVGIYVCLKLELSYLKNLIILSAALAGPYIGEAYFSYKNKKTPKKKMGIVCCNHFVADRADNVADGKPLK